MEPREGGTLDRAGTDGEYGDGDIAEDEEPTAAGSHSATAAIANVSQKWVMQMVAFK